MTQQGGGGGMGSISSTCVIGRHTHVTGPRLRHLVASSCHDQTMISLFEPLIRKKKTFNSVNKKCNFNKIIKIIYQLRLNF